MRKEVAFFQIILMIILVPIISAQTSNPLQPACCLESNSGELCKDVLADDSECNVDLIPGLCREISTCELGCCVDNEEGLCTARTTKASCEENAGVWVNEENCAINECRRGCCVLGSETQFVTGARCFALSDLFGFETDFRQQIFSELECLDLGPNAQRSACVFESGRCEMLSEVECNAFGGEYNSGLLCSNPLLETNCERQESVSCVEGSDNIYWFDSCGNQENIYNSNREASWNNGHILGEQESCFDGTGSLNSQNCGNCEYLLGSKCSQTGFLEPSVVDGNFICKSMNCVDENGLTRKNGESWCSYDGFIGEGKDTVGSRHWKMSCIDGEIKSEGCADYRGQICVEDNTEISEEEGNFSLAACVVNQASKCVSYNGDKETLIANCENNNHCKVERINIDDGFKFDLCVPKHPRGFDFNDPESGSLCALASQKCTVIDQKVFDGDGDFVGWENIVNENCESSVFGEQMNDLCVSLGDCGSYVNYIGEGTDNMIIGSSPTVDWKDYVIYSKPIEGQSAQIANLGEFLASLGRPVTSPQELEFEPTSFEQALTIASTVVGGSGTVISASRWTFGVEGAEGALFEGNPLPAGIVDFGAALSAASIGYTAGSYLAVELGFQGEAVTVMATLGAIGAGIGMAVGGPVGAIIGFVIGEVIGAVLNLFTGLGDTRETIVTSQCLMWQPPLGGERCGECNDDPLKPCSEYRCSSLGSACILVNENTESPTCVASEDDGQAPEIGLSSISESYEFISEGFYRSKIRRADGACVAEFSPVSFVLNTSEYAQCRFDFEQKESFEEMLYMPLEQNVFGENHTFQFMMPSLDSLFVFNVTGNILESFGDMRIFIRCRDAYGNFNNNEYVMSTCINSGPDLTAPYITLSSPVDGSALAYGKHSIEAIFYLNEPANCRYDEDFEKQYFEMEGRMECETDLFSNAGFGWPCSANLTGLNDEVNKINIKCADQPWYVGTVNESQINENSQGFSYTVYSSQSPLEITNIFPEEDIEIGYQPFSIDLKIETEGGARSGEARCSYSFGGETFSEFFDTGSSQHSQTFSTLLGGGYSIFVSCIDVAGNKAEGRAEFNLLIDDKPPTIVRAFREGQQLILHTDEEAECYYDPVDCLFDVNNATSMTTGLSDKHRTNWESGETYNIKCIDAWGNAPSGCSIKLLPSFF